MVSGSPGGCWFTRWFQVHQVVSGLPVCFRFTLKWIELSMMSFLIQFESELSCVVEHRELGGEVFSSTHLSSIIRLTVLENSSIR